MYDELFSRSGISLERLRSFCEVAEHGGIAKVAKGDLTKQSLISRQIRELEDFFKIELIKRQGRGIVITDAGKRLAVISREFLKSLNNFDSDCQNLPMRLSLVAPNSIIQWLILPRIGELQKQLGSTVVQVHHESTREIVQRVQDCIHDFGFVREDAVPKGLKKKKLGEVTYSLFVPKRLGGIPKESTIDALQGLPLALPIGGQLRQSLEYYTGKKGQKLTVSLECTSYLDALQALKGSKYAAVLPILARAELKDEGYVEIPLSQMKASNVCLIWNQRLVERRRSAAKAQKVLARIMVF